MNCIQIMVCIKLDRNPLLSEASSKIGILRLFCRGTAILGGWDQKLGGPMIMKLAMMQILSQKVGGGLFILVC